jgi:hypothetical protein
LKSASLLAKRGIDSLHIMRLGRWESIVMVLRYTQSVKFEESFQLPCILLLTNMALTCRLYFIRYGYINLPPVCITSFNGNKLIFL